MASRWTRRLFGGEPTEDPAARRAHDLMVAAFLDMDRRQSVAEAGVLASHELEPERGLRRRWDPIRQTCYQAGDSYLRLAQTEPGAPLAPAGAYEQALRQIADATRALDAFYEAHRGHLEHATMVAQATPQLAHRVATEARNVRDAVHLPEYAPFVHYPSVRTAGDDLDRALQTLETAHGTHTVRTAAAAVEKATTALRTALLEAPGRQDEAHRAIASVTTRIGAVRTRATGIAPAFSALLREFNAASSADLGRNERDAGELVDRADTDLADARRALQDGRPEDALERVVAIRTELTEAENLVDAVTARLATLRSVRQNPQARIDDVKFRLRDAQHLAVQRGMTAEWGSVLDSQLSRIDKAVEALSGVHPDYWAFVTELDAVTTFIAGVVDRMRGRNQDR